MKGGKTPLGYTIVEVMVVLAISGVMFMMASTFVNGKQARTAFTQGVNDFATRLQSMATQVGDGQFSDVRLQQCSLLGTHLQFTGSATSDQGTNNACVFLGKLMYFYKESGATLGAEKYAQFNLATALNGPSGDPITTLDSYVTAIKGLTTLSDVPQVLDITHMRINGGAEYFSVGFVQGLGSANDSDIDGAATFKTGSQTVGMVYGTSLTSFTPPVAISDADMETIATNNVNGQVAYASKVEVCLVDGSRRAKITMDVQAGGLNVDTQFLDGGGTTCW